MTHEICNGNFKVRCPGAKCYGGQLLFREVEELADEEVFSRFLQMVNDKLVFLSKNHKWCPKPNCNTICKVQTKSSASKATCPKCLNEFCSKCDQNWTNHPGKCEMISIEMNGDDDPFQACPGCQVPIQKKRGAGCHFMHCNICSTYFCWNCLGIISGRFHFKCTTGHINWEELRITALLISLIFTLILLVFALLLYITPIWFGQIQLRTIETVILGVAIVILGVAFLLQLVIYFYLGRHELLPFFNACLEKFIL